MKLILNLRVVFSGLMLLLPLFAYGDGFTRGVFQLSNAELDNQYKFIAEYPASKKSERLIIWPDACISVQAKLYQTNNVVTQTHILDCVVPLMSGDIITVPYQVDAAIFELQLGAWQSRTIVSSQKTGFHLVLQTKPTIDKEITNIAKDYLLQGVLHIWLGWDHLAFVFCLCLLAIGLRQLCWIITAFTLGHSVSMALSFFKLVSIAIPPIEAIIALSIVLIAREAWFQLNDRNQPNKVTRARMLIVVSSFGLVHGLGFASALAYIGVAVNERIPALIFFNLGVEAGQIAFVVLVFALMTLLRKAKKADVFARVALVCVGSAGCFWTIARIHSFNW